MLAVNRINKLMSKMMRVALGEKTKTEEIWHWSTVELRYDLN